MECLSARGAPSGDASGRVGDSTGVSGVVPASVHGLSLCTRQGTCCGLAVVLHGMRVSMLLRAMSFGEGEAARRVERTLCLERTWTNSGRAVRHGLISASVRGAGRTP